MQECAAFQIVCVKAGWLKGGPKNHVLRKKTTLAHITRKSLLRLNGDYSTLTILLVISLREENVFIL